MFTAVPGCAPGVWTGGGREAHGSRMFCTSGRSVAVRQDAPWFDTACRAAHRAYWRARRRATAPIEFRDAERHYKQLVRSRQRQWQQRQLDQNLADSHRNPRALYLRLRDHPAPLPAVLRNHSAWDSFLHGLASYRPPSNCELKTAPCLPSFDPDASAELNVETITASEVLAAMRQLHNGRSSGCGELSGEWYRYAVPLYRPAAVAGGAPIAQPAHLLAGTLAALFSAAFAAGSIPGSWTTSAITPIHKKGDPAVTSNYRPVAVGTPIARLYASILKNRISPYFEAENLRAQAQAGFRPRRSVNHNLFALQHAIDKSRRYRQPLYCCFVDLTAAFDRVPRRLLWERLCACGVSGRMLAAVQSLYSDAQIVVNISGCIGDSQMPVSGVKQGCPLSPTLFGVFIDALEGWLSHRAAAAGVSIQCENGGSRLLSSLIYADDLALVSNSPSHLHGLIDALSDFCASAGLEISATKTQVMQFLPLVRNRPLPEQHSFSFGSDTASICLVNTSHYKYLGVTFCSSGNPSDYMPAARHNMVGAYAGLRRRYCGLACGKHVRLQLPLFTAIVTTSAMYAGELWGVHPRSAAQRRMTAQKHSKFLRQLIRVSPSTETAILLAELGHLSLQQRWLQASIRFWNALIALPVDDLFRDVLYDSLQDATSPGPRNAGFAKGVRDQCALLGFSLTADQPRLLPICLETVMGLSRSQLQSEAVNVDVCPRTCPTEGAACCKYTRWFRRTSLQCARPVHELPQRICTRCQHGLGDDRHLVFECTKLQHIRDRYAHLFQGCDTMQSFMNQGSQKGVMNFVSDCLDCDAQLVGGGQQRRPDEEEGTDT